MPIVHQRWAKTGESGKATWPSVSRTWLSHIWPEQGSNHTVRNLMDYESAPLSTRLRGPALLVSECDGGNWCSFIAPPQWSIGPEISMWNYHQSHYMTWMQPVLTLPPKAEHQEIEQLVPVLESPRYDPSWRLNQQPPTPKAGDLLSHSDQLRKILMRQYPAKIQR